MKVTESDGLKHRQLQDEGYLQRVPAAQREYAEACELLKMTETDSTNTNEQTEGDCFRFCVNIPSRDVE